MDLPLFQALWQLGDVPPERAHVEATALLEAGIDSPALVELAGAVTATNSADLDPIVRRAFNELRLPPMSESEARWVVAFEVARQIAASEVEPLEGACQLWVLATDLGLPGQPINYFVYLAADHGEGPRPPAEEKAWFDAKIVETAHELLSQRDSHCGIVGCDRLTRS